MAESATSQRLLAELVRLQIGLRRFEAVTPTLHQIFIDKVGADAQVAERREEEAK